MADTIMDSIKALDMIKPPNKKNKFFVYVMVIDPKLKKETLGMWSVLGDFSTQEEAADFAEQCADKHGTEGMMFRVRQKNKFDWINNQDPSKIKHLSPDAEVNKLSREYEKLRIKEQKKSAEMQKRIDDLIKDERDGDPASVVGRNIYDGMFAWADTERLRNELEDAQKRYQNAVKTVQGIVRENPNIDKEWSSKYSLLLSEFGYEHVFQEMNHWYKNNVLV